MYIMLTKLTYNKGVATKRGVRHGVGYGLSYGLPVVNIIKQFTPESLKILIIIRHKCEGIAPKQKYK